MFSILSAPRRLNELAAIGALAICTAAPAAPPNDQCADASSITLGVTPFTTFDAATDEPAMPCTPASGASGDVWFRFDATFDGRVRIATCGSDTFDSILTVYSGCGCTDAALLAVLRCSDNACADDARVSLDVTAGRCYLIRVAGVNGDEGHGQGDGILTIELIGPENAAGAEIILTGEHPGDRFGQSVAAAGDFKNDGVDDVIVGAHLNDTEAGNAGRAMVRMGQTLAAVTGFSGEFAGDNFGRTVAGGCDFDRDGFSDVLVGAPLNDDNGVNAGKVYCFSGFDDTVLWTVRGQLPGDQLGSAVACIGDVNGDGVSDVIIGAPRNDIAGKNTGRVYIVAGQDGSVIEILGGKYTGEQFGSAVAAIGDINDDGINDFAVSAPLSRLAGPNAGRVIIFNSATMSSLQVLKGDPGERFGTAISGLTLPVGAQTRTYLAVGAPDNPAKGAQAGRARLFMRIHDSTACARWLCEMWRVDGERAGDRLGASVAVGDVRGGTVPEVVFGAPGSDANGEDSGVAYVMLAANGAIKRRIVGETAGDAFGSALAIAGDINNDETQDFVIGAPLNDARGNKAGRAYLFLSNSPSLLRGGGDTTDDLLEEFGVARLAAVPTFALSCDADGDGDCDADDLLTVVSRWGECPRPRVTESCTGDLNSDGRVDSADLLLAVEAVPLDR